MNVCATVLISCFRGILSFEVDLFEIFKDVASQGFGGRGWCIKFKSILNKKKRENWEDSLYLHLIIQIEKRERNGN